MPHAKGVSHKSDRKILSELLENKKGLSPTDLQKRTGLNKNTIPARLNILEQQGKIISASVKGKHGHHKRCYIPWSQYEIIYNQIYGKLSPSMSHTVDEIENWLEKTFGKVVLTVTKDLKIKTEIPKARSIEIILSSEFEEFVKEHPWINALSSDEDVTGDYARWLEGRLCPDCLKNRILRPLNKVDQRNQYVCEQCGATFWEDELPIPDRIKRYMLI